MTRVGVGSVPEAGSKRQFGSTDPSSYTSTPFCELRWHRNHTRHTFEASPFKGPPSGTPLEPIGRGQDFACSGGAKKTNWSGPPSRGVGSCRNMHQIPGNLLGNPTVYHTCLHLNVFAIGPEGSTTGSVDILNMHKPPKPKAMVPSPQSYWGARYTVEHCELPDQMQRPLDV